MRDRDVIGANDMIELVKERGMRATPGSRMPIVCQQRLAFSPLRLRHWPRARWSATLLRRMRRTGALATRGAAGALLAFGALVGTAPGWLVEAAEVSADPEFPSSTATRDVNETDVLGVEVGKPVMATDADNDVLTYTLSGADATSFTIDDDSGQIRNGVALDYEMTTSYSVTVTAEDGSGSASIMVTINVLDVAEQGDIRIVDGSSATSGRIEVYVDDTWGSVCDDAFGGPEALVACRQLGFHKGRALYGPDDVNPGTGPVVNMDDVACVGTEARLLDCPHTPRGEGDCTNLEDVGVACFPDDGTVEVSGLSDASTHENVPWTSTPTLFGSIATWTLEGTDATDFTIDATTGAVSMQARDYESPVDEDEDNDYEVTVRATDANGNAGTQSFTLRVTNVPEPGTQGDIRLDDGSSDGLSGRLKIFLDGSWGSVCDYDVDERDARVACRQLGFAGGEGLRLISIPGPHPIGALACVGTEQRLLDCPHSVPDQCYTENYAGVACSAATGLGLTRIWNASTPENTRWTSLTPTAIGATGTVTWALGGADDAAGFTINASTGVVSLPARDYEIPVDADTDNDYELTVTATDTANGTGTASFTVTVTDVVEASTVTIGGLSNATTSENESWTSPTPSATGAIGSTTWRKAGPDVDEFVINGDTGVLTLAPQDYEAFADANGDSAYEVTVTATDEDANAGQRSLSIRVEDVIEASTVTISRLSDATTAENVPWTSVVPRAAGAIGAVAWSKGGADSGVFRLDAAIGVLTLPARNYEVPTDTDGNNVYTVTVTATDGDGNVGEVSIDVTVVDSKETATVTIQGLADASTRENESWASPRPVAVGAIGSARWAKEGADADAFAIDPNSGVLTLSARNYEDPSDADRDNDYEVTVKATDADSNADVQSIEVTVTDVTEVATVTVTGLADDSIPENQSWQSRRPMAIGAIGSVRWSREGVDEDDFSVDANRGVLTLASRDYEKPTDSNVDNVYEVTLRATDDDQNSGLSSIRVEVTDVTEGGTASGGSSSGGGSGSGSSGSGSGSSGSSGGSSGSGSGSSGSSGGGSGSGSGSSGSGGGGSGGGSGSRNRPPVTTDPMPARTLEVGATVELDASGHFRDPEQRTMMYTAESDDDTVATVEVEDEVLTIHGVDHGVTSVTVTATDHRRLTATQSFEVTVGRVVSFANPAVSVPEGGTATLTVAISRALDVATTLDYLVAGDAVEATPDADEADHSGRDGAVTIAAESTEARIEIEIVDDSDIEPPRETFAVTLRAAPEQARDFGLGVATAVVTIEEGTCDRTAQVRNALRRSLPCTAVSEMDLAALRTLNLADRSIDALRTGDLSDLTGLRALDLSGNGLTELPQRLFEGLGGLTELRLHGNPGAPFALTIRLVRTDADISERGPATVVAQLAEGAPFAARTEVSATGGALSGSALLLPAGAAASAPITATQAGAIPTRITPVAPPLPDTRCGEFDDRPCFQGFTLQAGETLTLFKDPPSVTGEAPRAELGTDGDARRVDLRALFSAADGGALTFVVESSDPGLATATIRDDVLSVASNEEGREGSATITVTATDGDGLSATLTFVATVEMLPRGLLRGWRRVWLQEVMESRNQRGE